MIVLINGQNYELQRYSTDLNQIWFEEAPVCKRCFVKISCTYILDTTDRYPETPYEDTGYGKYFLLNYNRMTCVICYFQFTNIHNVYGLQSHMYCNVSPEKKSPGSF